jgi:hypothetical protein
MTLQFICAEIERLRLQVRRKQKEVFTLQRSGIGTASAELLLARMQASVDALCIKRDKLVRKQRVVPLCTNNGDVILRRVRYSLNRRLTPTACRQQPLSGSYRPSFACI